MYILYMNVQAVLFSINDWNTNDCRKWLNNHGYIPLKRVHKTNIFLDIELYNQIIMNMYIVLKLLKNTH